MTAARVSPSAGAASSRGCCLGGRLCLGLESFVSVTIYTPWRPEAENACKLRGGGTTPKEEQSERTLTIVTKPLTVVTGASGLMVGHEMQCLSGLYLSDLFDTYKTMKISHKANLQDQSTGIIGFFHA